MTRFLELLISMAIVAVLFVVVGVLLPSSRTLVERVETNRKLTIVYDTLNSLRRFKDWSPITLYDPKAELKLSGPTSGVGARVDYASDVSAIGEGSWEIVETEPGERVLYAVTDERRGDNKRTEFTLRPTGRSGRNVEITQTYKVDYGWDLLGRYAGLYVSRNVGDGMKLGLQRLSNMLASVPNVDYAVEGSKMRGMQVVERPAEDLLVVKAGAVERNNEKIKASMKANMEWIKRTMDANNLVAAGPMRIISTELGRENYTFDIAQPVRKAGSNGNGADDADEAEAADDAAAAEGEGSEGAEGEAAQKPDVLTAVVASTEPLEIKIPDGAPVEYVRTEPRRAAVAFYTGFMAELDNVRNALRAWALTQGYEVTDRPYEIYKNGIDTAFTADGEYEVYWTLRQ